MQIKTKKRIFTINVQTLNVLQDAAEIINAPAKLNVKKKKMKIKK